MENRKAKLSQTSATPFNGSVSNVSKRQLIKTVGAASLMSLVDPLVKVGAWAAGSDGPENRC